VKETTNYGQHFTTQKKEIESCEVPRVSQLKNRVKDDRERKIQRKRERETRLMTNVASAAGRSQSLTRQTDNAPFVTSAGDDLINQWYLPSPLHCYKYYTQQIKTIFPLNGLNRH
jgi:hypothetical protein